MAKGVRLRLLSLRGSWVQIPSPAPSDPNVENYVDLLYPSNMYSQILFVTVALIWGISILAHIVGTSYKTTGKKTKIVQLVKGSV